MAAPEPFFFEFGAREREMLAAPLLPPLRRVSNFFKHISWLLGLFGGYLLVLFFYLEASKDGHSSKTNGFHDHLDFPSHLNMYAPNPNYTALNAIQSASMLPSNHPHSIDALAAQVLTANKSVADLISFTSRELACAVRSHDGSPPPRQTNTIIASAAQQARRLSLSAAARHGSIQQEWFDPTADTYRTALAQAKVAFAAATPSVREKTAYAWRIWPGLFGFLVGDAAAGEMDRAEQAARRRWEAAQRAWDAHQAGGKDVAEQQAALVGFAAEMEGLQDLVVAVGSGGPAARAALKTGYFERVVRPGGDGWDRFEEGWKMLVACGQRKGGAEASAVRQGDETQKRKQEEEQEWGRDGQSQKGKRKQKQEEHVEDKKTDGELEEQKEEGRGD